MKKGNISLFLSLLLIPILILLLSLLESARYYGLQSQFRTAGDAAAESLFSLYDRELLDEYGLLFYPGGSGTIDQEAIESQFCEYADANMSTGTSGLFGGSFFQGKIEEAELTKLIRATDYDGEMFIRSALKFYKYDAPGELLETIKKQLSLFQQGEYDSDLSVQDAKIPEIGGKPILKKKSDAENSRKENVGSDSLIEVYADHDSSDTDPDDSEVDWDQYNQMIADSPIGAAEEAKAKGFMKFVIPKGKGVSSYQMDLSDSPSVIGRDDRSVDQSFIEDVLLKVTFNEYLLEYFPCFTEQKERKGVQYELEYLLFGEADDQENLKSTVKRLMWLREGMNLVHVMASDFKSNACEVMAFALVAWTGVEAAIPGVKLALEAAWAYAESLFDLRILLSGGKVPIVKEEETWNLNLSNVVSFFRGSEETAKENQIGLSYEDYLRILLFLTDANDLAYRAMDMIQENRRETIPGFLMTSEIYGMEIRASMEAEDLFTALWFYRRKLWNFGQVYTFQEYFSRVY